jgi:glycosyltransferase involved in cell wall biosynthesis
MALNILWLCSWYPNDTNPYDGDFIQRHAEAVSQNHSIDVLYVHKHIGPEPTPAYTKMIRNEKLTEHIITNHVKRDHWFYHLLGLLNFFLIHLRFIRLHGRPALIHVQIPIKAGTVALFYKWVYKVPYLVTEHYGIYNASSDDHFKSRHFFFRYATRLVIKYANVLTTVSDSLGKDINQWVVQKPYIVIPNVVDTQLFTFTEPLPKKSFRFIHISNMIPLKNVGGIIEATERMWHERQDFSITLIGRIEEEFYQLAQSKQLLNKVVFFEGEIPYSQVASAMKESDALIIFSDTESQSCVVLESLCCGRPAIVTNVGGVKELIHAANGYKVNVRDTDDLVCKMRDLINNYATFDLSAISQHATALYSYDSVAQQFDAVYIQHIPSRR